MTTLELAARLGLVIPEANRTSSLPANAELAAFAVASTVVTVRELQPDLVIPLIRDDGGKFGAQVAMGAPTREPLMLRQGEHGELRLSAGVLSLVSQAKRVVFVSEILPDSRESAELITLFGLGERAVGVVTLWDKRQLEWPTIAGVPVHAVFRGRQPEARPALTRTQAIRKWLGV